MAYTRSAHTFFSSELPTPGAVAAINTQLRRALEALGVECTPRFPDFGDVEPVVAQLLPLAHADLAQNVKAAPPVDFAVFDDAGLELMRPAVSKGARVLVLYHGLMNQTGTWLTDPDIDLHIANSAYLARVLRSLFAYPDLKRGTILDPRAYARVHPVRVPLALVGQPGGLSHAWRGPGGVTCSRLPDQALALLDGDAICGHAMHHGKLDWSAVGAIMIRLNQRSMAAALGPVRLFVPRVDLEQMEALARRQGADGDARQMISSLDELGLRVEDVFHPLPYLAHEDMVHLLSCCEFGLAYNYIPESFGVNVLESVYCGCPVYTNGVGNLRSLLPAGHGVFVGDPPFDRRSEQAIADLVFEHVLDPVVAGECCDRGVAFIESNHDAAAFRTDLAALLETVSRPPPAVDPEELEVVMSPLVRHWTGTAGAVVSDYRSGALSSEEASLVADSLGRSLRDIVNETPEVRRRLLGLFKRGILCMERGSDPTREPR